MKYKKYSPMINREINLNFNIYVEIKLKFPLINIKNIFNLLKFK